MDSRQYVSLAWWARNRGPSAGQATTGGEHQREDGDSSAGHEENGADGQVFRPDWTSRPRAA